MPNKRPKLPENGPTLPENEISWRTEELGPEMRRKLFEKMMPSVSAAAPREGPASTGKDATHSERPKGTKPPRK